jgi:hypothetical protein
VTGDEHYREAERLVELARKAGIRREPGPTRLTIGGGGRNVRDDRELYTDESSDPTVRSLLADAQVHATLALAAATRTISGASTSGPQPAPPPMPPLQLGRHDGGEDYDEDLLQ